MKRTLKIAIYVLLASGFAVVLMVLASSLIDPTSNQAKNQTNSNIQQAVLGKMITLSPRPKQPNAKFLNAAGEKLVLEQFKGKVILLNIWATWCEPCVEEMPSLDALQDKLGGDDFEVIAISEDRSIEDVKTFYQEYNIENLTIYMDEKFSVVTQLYVKDYPKGLPITILYDRQGREIFRLSGGFDWVSDEAITRIEKVILSSTVKE
ncbi:MAG: redoxin domain-containing protein [Robiginitomaculum sp.]|nr:redoxin domain-containing protein [Robiginitomaculum sp.]